MFFYAIIYVQAILVWDAVEAPAVLLEGIARSSTPAGLDTEGSLKVCRLKAASSPGWKER